MAVVALQDKYPQILLTSATAEFLGAMLFASDIRFGAQVLVCLCLNTAKFILAVL